VSIAGSAPWQQTTGTADGVSGRRTCPHIASD
jgi:hypothetical protein